MVHGNPEKLLTELVCLFENTSVWKNVLFLSPTRSLTPRPSLKATRPVKVTRRCYDYEKWVLDIFVCTLCASFAASLT